MKNTYSFLMQDWKLRMVAIAILTACLCVFFNLFFSFESGYPFWMIVLSNFIYVLLSFEFTRIVVFYVRKKNPGLKSSEKRIAWIGLTMVGASFLIGPAHIFIEKDLLFGENLPHTIYNYLSASGSTLFFTLIIASVYEAMYFFAQWHKTSLEKEALEKANLQTQFELLKNQVQPHFLFNSLNTLLSLVDEDTIRAKKFIKQLSFVYRYLLLSNEKTLISLGEELGFIQAYFFLLQTRFEEGLELKIAIPADLENYLLPPLTLQILLENAVKHNMLSSASPLLIRIESNDQQEILIRNNLQLKKASVHSARVGLANISAKYHFLNQPQILIRETEDEFIVRLPLIEPSPVHIHTS
ncbi:histidine kinase [Rhodocytophaga aerolata]|uniref:Histidine kinase n=1 Tax=Rhodocytophaga aerolata TaxID=455078 RepID=A0ABT8RHC8_9BACT|nr:histidine kinase [Rhodocytophaga aerolata]MDO1451499.1 histidine kinase [Rhodocytophaga aerolata]